MSVTIAVDMMSGDRGAPVAIQAALKVLQGNNQVHLILVGDESVIRPKMERSGKKFQDRWAIHHTTEVVHMEDSPVHVLRRKKKSSMRLAINLVQEGKAHACVSAGNTGALMATAHYVLKTIPGVERPAIVSAFPTVKPGKQALCLDLGATVDTSIDQLVQFAVMGSTLAQVMSDVKEPVVGLMNVGKEDIKGTESVKAVHERLLHSSLNYCGYVEGNDVFSGEADVLVVDGFSGNVALKSIEGVMQYLMNAIKSVLRSSPWLKVLALLAYPLLRRIKRTVDPDRYNGAILLGLNGIVVKSHGGANKVAFYYAIQEAVATASQDMINLIHDRVAAALQED